MNKLVKLISVPLLALSLQAGDWNTQSLVAIEGGASSFDLNNNMGYPSDSQSPATLGLKVGAESQNYRIFLSGRYYSVSDQFDYANSFGVEAQYIFRFSSNFNIFAGINAGVMNMEFDDTNAQVREISQGYFGGDIGTNISLNHNLDVEVGVRYINLNVDNTQYVENGLGASVPYTYDIDNMVNTYISLIYKFKI
jgi:hypothetical protein